MLSIYFTLYTWGKGIGYKKWIVLVDNLSLFQLFDGFTKLGSVGTNNFIELFTILVEEESRHGTNTSFSSNILYHPVVRTRTLSSQWYVYLQERHRHQSLRKRSQGIQQPTSWTWGQSTCRDLNRAACYMRNDYYQGTKHVYQLTAPSGVEIDSDLVNAFMSTLYTSEKAKCCTYLLVLGDKLLELFKVLGFSELDFHCRIDINE